MQAMPYRFANFDPAHRPHGASAILRWAVLDRLRGRRRVAEPGPPAPAVPPDLNRIRSENGGSRLTWIGHASFLGTLAGRSFLLDPVFADRAGPVHRRFGAPGLRPAKLPPIRAVLVSHNHYDHLDAAAISAIPRSVPVVVPAGLGSWLERRGRRAIELGWWQTVDVDGLSVTLVPARHWSRRGIFDTNQSWWGGYVVEAGGRSIYHAGDTARFDGFTDIASRFPGIDVAMLPVGGYEPAWFMEHHHLNPEQAGEAFCELGSRVLVPMHWGAFQLTDEPLSEPAERIRRWWAGHGPSGGRQLRVMAVGETIELE